MRKRLQSLLIALFISACSSTNDNEVVIFNNISFNLIEGEKLCFSETNNKEHYHAYFSNTDLQIPLFRCIENKDYLIYIGIPFNTSLSELVEFQILNHLESPISFESDTLSYFYKSHKIGTDYHIEYSKEIDKNLIYILAVTNSRAIFDSLFSHKTLSNRISKK